MQHRAERPWIRQAVIRKLNERERIELRSQTSKRNAASKRSWRKTGAHVGERRWCRHRLRCPHTAIRCLIAIHSDAIASEQPITKPRLALTEQLEVKIPNTFYCPNP